MNVNLYLRQFFIVASGTAAAQVINLAAYPILTRLYSPTDFGIFALFVTVASVIGIIAAGRFDLIVQSGHDEELVGIYYLSQVLNLLISGSATLVLATGSLLDIGGMKLEHALLAGVAVFLTGFTASSSLFLIRHEEYHHSTRSAAARSLFTVLPQIGLWFVWPSAMSLLVGFCIGLAAQSALLVGHLRRYDLSRPGRDQLTEVWRRYRLQAAIDVPGAVLGALALHVLNFFLLVLYSAADVGQYALAFRVAVMPLSLFAASLSQVFFQKAAASYRRGGTFWPEVRLNLLWASMLSVAVFVPMVLLARPAFTFAFGDEWRLAADILIYLAPMLAIRFVSATLQSVPLVVRRPSWLLAHNVGLLVAMGVAFVVAIAIDLPLGPYLILNSALMAAVYLAYLIAMVTVVRRHYRNTPSNVTAMGSVE